MRFPADQYRPQTRTNNRAEVVWLTLLIGSLIFAFSIIAAPLATSNARPAVAFTIYQAFSHLCHQFPDRSYYIAGYPLAVCARCTGVYFGFAFGVAAYPLMRSLGRTDTPARKWLIVAALPLAIDFASTFFGLWQNTHTSRLLTGALLGAIAVFYVVPGLMDLLLGRRKARLLPLPSSLISHKGVAPSDYSAPHRRI
jgi:uncharacterized membrane protein